MDPTITGGQTDESRAASSDPPAGEGLPKQAQLLWHELRGLAHDHLRLAALETQQAGESLVVMIAAGIILAGLLLSVWLGLLIAAVFELTSRGIMAFSSALLLTVAVNLVVGFALWVEILRRSRHLIFPANTRTLQPGASELADKGRV